MSFMSEFGEVIELHRAVIEGDATAVQRLIDGGGDVHATNEDGDTALMLAKNVEVAKVLLEAGA
eukprot:CAMPEP_0198310268 /NCGR_PEP_ID=MMETSP1450-20131203/2400_1 /TAXON_ID=753684 ORGANISM="Madagascaria erythrocladiodes, Strain CCMP3234" /NCGR_SAMPLE_ID=MMETSP1450 /ASSEMBLY_ACC=CAM_ASM_001115 /LENGTH=63 /DNA_ID=CAMNT_0044013085 /DNA_START=73 /DNA_END=261 /DNA_ORIENTATION=+